MDTSILRGIYDFMQGDVDVRRKTDKLFQKYHKPITKIALDTIRPRLDLHHKDNPTGVCDRLNVVSCYVIVGLVDKGDGSPDISIKYTSPVFTNNYPNKPCTTEGHIMRNGSCVRTIHAEMHALLHMNNHLYRPDGRIVLYSSHEPCIDCSKHISGWSDELGIIQVLYENEYSNKYTKAPEEEYNEIRGTLPYIDIGGKL